MFQEQLTIQKFFSDTYLTLNLTNAILKAKKKPTLKLISFKYTVFLGSNGKETKMK